MRNKGYYHTLLFLFVISIFALSNANAATKKTDTVWGYSGLLGPTHWAILNPEFKICATGKNQSPIDIKNALPSQQNSLQINYQSAPLRIIKDGTTRLDIHNRKLVVNDGHTIQLNFPQSGPQETITYAGNYYRLVQLHFHFPSENHINGKSYPAEIHFVHQGLNGRVAVVGVFIEPGKANAAIASIIANLPRENDKLYYKRNVAIAIQSLLPQNKSFYSFTGSLTTPPCSEGLQWLVMEHAIQASPQQISMLTAAIKEHNARPIQPINKRDILYVTTN